MVLDTIVVVVDRMLKGLFLDKPDEEGMLLDNVLVVALVVPMDNVPVVVVVVDIVAAVVVVVQHYYPFEYYRLITNKVRTVDGGGLFINVHRNRLAQFSKLKQTNHEITVYSKPILIKPHNSQ